MDRLLKLIFVLLIAKPVVNIALGINLIQRSRLPDKGPVIIAANHNSHLDVLVLLAMFPLRIVHRVRPVAAADYFLSNPVLAWFSLHVIGIIPLQRAPDRKTMNSMFDECNAALERGDILIIFPEGSRGKPEVLSSIKKGIYRMVRERSGCPVLPVIMRGLGRSLPKGSARFVPFNCDVIIGEPIAHFDNAQVFVERIEAAYAELSTYCLTCDYYDEE